ncbi:hypothetical protein KAR91_06395 [Candidatus Pacearchaeota archaeon]|nr:hypothetical protein [Candidatus Pacearchaeota archaeon]
MREIKQNTDANVKLFLTDEADHILGKTGLTLAVELCKDNESSFSTITAAASASEIANGWYNIDLTTSNNHTSTLGDLIVRATASGADSAERLLTVVENIEADTYTAVATHETARASMETILQTEHGLLMSGISNIGSGISRIQTSLVDQVLVPSGNNWVKVVVLVNDSAGALFDPADIVDPSGSPVYNGVGAKFTDIDDDQVVMYKDNIGTPLDQVTLCAHAPQSNKPQLLERTAHGLYYYWMNATATGNALPVGQLKTLFGLFDIAQAEATYSGTSPFLIQDTDPSSHLHILFAITVSAETGTNERLDDIIEDIAEHETARDTMQTRIEGTGYDPAQNSLKNIKDTIG